MTMIDPATGQPVPAPPQYNPNAPSPIHVHVPPAPPAAPADTVFTKEQMEQVLNAERERVRQEEKNKLYPEIEQQKEALRLLTEERDARVAAEEEAQAALAEQQRLAAEAELTASERIENLLLEQRQTMDQRFQAIEQERDTERALREKENQFAQLSLYKETQLREHTDDIVPQLMDFVRGNTEAEIDASIQQVVQRSAEIAAEVQARQTQQFRSTAPPPTGAPVRDPLAGEGETRSLTPEDIRNMTMEEYQASRPQILAAQRQHIATNGLYGQ